MRAEPNLGNIERIVRVVIAIILISLYFLGFVPRTVGILLTILGGILVASAYLSFCPLWGILRISTKKQK
ncbi:MAG: DUF2892 domain-containing protein [Chitinophagales bacterium]|nr:DUF2892 domain-containing protein [Chitinophagales bacterium]MCZ2392586.1 DUF2892 domain-containing protein [Chitinophagales bacterium]